MITLEQAILSLNPNAEFTCNGGIYSGITWTNNPLYKPTEAEIAAEVTRLQAEYDALNYQRLRRSEYNKLNQDEMRYDDVKNSTTTWVDAIDAIKDKYPKE